MTDPPGTSRGRPRAEERLPRPTPAERAGAGRRGSRARRASAHAVGLTPERAAQIVRQTSSAAGSGSWPSSSWSCSSIVYCFYELGVPGSPVRAGSTRESRPSRSQRVERGYNLFEANCARCHGDNGQGGIGPVLNDQDKLCDAT